MSLRATGPGYSWTSWIIIISVLCFHFGIYEATHVDMPNNYTMEHTEAATDMTIENTDIIIVHNETSEMAPTPYFEEFDPSVLGNIKCEDFTIDLYRRWTMVYKINKDDIKKLLCKCRGVCLFYTVAPDVLEKIRDKQQNVLSDVNKSNFIIVMSSFSAIFLLGVAGNITTIVGLLTWMKQRSPTYGFVISLCCSGLLMLFICMPIKATEFFKVSHIFTEITCKLSYYARDITFVSTVLTHTIISFERFYAICRPMEVKYRCTWRRARKLIIMTWVLSICLAIPTPFMMKHYYDEKRLTIECLPQSESLSVVIAYFMYMLGILFVIPCLIMVVTYTMSCTVLCKSTNVAKKLQETSGGCDKGTRQKGSNCVGQRRRVVALLIVAVVLFITSWAPHLVFQLLEVTDKIHYIIDANYAKNLIVIGVGITYLGSAINPYLFMAMSSQFCEQSTCRNCCHKRRDIASYRSSGSETDKDTKEASSSLTRAHEIRQTHTFKD
ncbi:QRFP-like peptide receptor [Mercenaria mercenaria]|uniref:QRFP-like peptide receptor n=1 Tax=Mercenaria mercenaria TaxID=6596 RepID=UPI00234F2333|nr:QRFP-like peptide receptor [Mercenaria mercenaria]